MVKAPTKKKIPRTRPGISPSTSKGTKTISSTKPENDIPIRRQKTMRPIAASLPRLTKQLTGKRGFAEAGLIEDWSAIVGKELSTQCLPIKLRYPSQGVRNDGTLLIKADPAFALVIQQQAPQLIERVNSHFGYRAIAKLSIQQGPLYKVERKTPPKLPMLNKIEQQTIQTEFADVKNEALRLSLERIAQTLKAKNKINKK
ncbi:DUF721 domain-containing protein [Kiloniella antarctica]|uniref:DUF721 domain-containing protein n=1 Tax=Kiloniella antarctica TaxID=1550907 RepID=A0ABW5BEC0_9PROT